MTPGSSFAFEPLLSSRRRRGRAQRFSIQISLRFRLLGSAAPWSDATTCNISGTGVLFETTTAPRPGEVLEMVLMVGNQAAPAAADICCTGPVVRVNPPPAAAGAQRVSVNFTEFRFAPREAQPE
jgi:hypothetical protein